jgi:hypothetical protein
MRAFSLGVVVAILLGVGAWIGLRVLEQSSADAFSTSAVRLDRAESVNDYGRAG